jgi:hypothetical protein
MPGPALLARRRHPSGLQAMGRRAVVIRGQVRMVPAPLGAAPHPSAPSPPVLGHLRPRAFGEFGRRGKVHPRLGPPRALGTRRALPLPATLQLADLRTLGGDLALPLGHQGQPLLTTPRGERFGRQYGRH